MIFPSLETLKLSFFSFSSGEEARISSSKLQLKKKKIHKFMERNLMREPKYK